MNGHTAEMTRLVAQLRKAGVPVTLTRGGHWKVSTPNGPVFMASTPSDHRGIRNDVARLRRYGLAV